MIWSSATRGDNRLVEFSPQGKVTGVRNLFDTGAPGAFLGSPLPVRLSPTTKIYFNDDNDNTVKVLVALGGDGGRGAQAGREPTRIMTEGELLWTPDPAETANLQVAQFMRFVSARHGLALTTYEELWRWSVSDLEAFWAAVWDFFEVHSTEPYERVLEARTMPGAVWFRGSRVNYAEHLLRYERVAAPGEAAIVHSSELRPLAEMTWHELGAAVRVLATQLRALGIRPGDRWRRTCRTSRSR